jgi:hypothetical protein
MRWRHVFRDKLNWCELTPRRQLARGFLTQLVLGLAFADAFAPVTPPVAVAAL